MEHILSKKTIVNWSLKHFLPHRQTKIIRLFVLLTCMRVFVNIYLFLKLLTFSFQKNADMLCEGLMMIGALGTFGSRLRRNQLTKTCLSLFLSQTKQIGGRDGIAFVQIKSQSYETKDYPNDLDVV